MRCKLISNLNVVSGDIHLREIKPSDAQAVYDVFKHRQSAAWFNCECTTCVQDASALIARLETYESVLAICVRSDPELPVGVLCCSVNPEQPDLVFISYAINTCFQHMGIMSHAIKLLVTYLYASCSVSSVVGCVYEGNTKSAMCLRSCGFTRAKQFDFTEDTLTGRRDVMVYMFDCVRVRKSLSYAKYRKIIMDNLITTEVAG